MGKLETKYKLYGLPQKIRFAVFERDNWTCQYCCRGKESVKLCVDHFLTVQDGGRSTMDNLITACAECNNKKGSKLPSRWIKELLIKYETVNL